MVLELRAEALLSGPTARLGELARIEAPSAELRTLLEDLPAARAPLAGYAERRGRTELDAWLRGQAALQGHRIVWRGADSVTLRTASASVSGVLLAREAAAYLLAAYGELHPALEAVPAGPVQDVAVPAGELQLRARPLEKGQPRTRMAVWIDVLVRGSVVRSVLVPMSVSAKRTVYVARHALAAGSEVVAADFEQHLRDVASMQDEPAAVGTLAAGGRLRLALAEGQPLLRKQLAPMGQVLRGDRVRLLAGAGGVRVETSAVAQENAVQGQPVRVLPQGGAAAIMARVTAPGIVSLDER